MLCCAGGDDDSVVFDADRESVCGAPAKICKHFYDSAPSGSFGTMSYIVRACCTVLEVLPNDGTMECKVS
jgi:phosphorylase kinase alpha/beta subunit